MGGYYKHDGLDEYYMDSGNGAGDYIEEIDENEKVKGKRGNSVMKLLTAVNVTVALTLSLYFVTVFTEVPVLSTARDLWIETAMTTAEHQWLATSLFPGWLIDRIMLRQIITDEDTLSNPYLVHAYAAAGDLAGENMGYGAGPESTIGAGGSAGMQPGSIYADRLAGSTDIQNSDRSLGDRAPGDWAPGDVGGSAGADGLYGENGAGYSLYNNTGKYNFGAQGYRLPDIGFFSGFDYRNMEEYISNLPAFPAVGDIDEFGNTVIISDRDEDIYVVEIHKTGYTGRILFVSDPSRVVVRHTRKKNVQGELLKSFLNEYGAIAGMNGNGFDDPEGHGKGGTIIGWSVADGVAWGAGPKSEYASIGFNDQHVLLAGTIKNFETHNIRDLAQYGPSLIVDGKKLISGSGGWGLQPRSGIGQREDGTILMATFDGRQPGHSLGITAGDVADIFMQYGCINAGLCDGGSSSVMMYDGDVIGKPSTPMKDTGRYLPNAFLVLRKSTGLNPDADIETDVASNDNNQNGHSSET